MSKVRGPHTARVVAPRYLKLGEPFLASPRARSVRSRRKHGQVAKCAHRASARAPRLCASRGAVPCCPTCSSRGAGARRARKRAQRDLKEHTQKLRGRSGHESARRRPGKRHKIMFDDRGWKGAGRLVKSGRRGSGMSTGVEFRDFLDPAELQLMWVH